MELRKLYEIYAPDPRATMPLGLRVNDVVYLGNVTGADPATGEIDPEAGEQLKRALDLLRDCLESAGAKLTDVRQVVACVAATEDGELIEIIVQDSLRGAWVEAEVVPLPPGQLVRLEAIASLGSGEDEASLLFAGSTPYGARIGDVLFSAGISAADPETGAVSGNTQAQMQAAFANLDHLLEAAGADRSSILRIGGYLRDLGEKDALNGAMVQAFPDASQKPVHKYVPAALPEGINVSLQLIARLGAERQIIEIEGIRHNDPISLGAKSGNLFVSSRVQGRMAESAEEQAERLVSEHARTLLRHVGGGLEHVTQTVWGVGDPAYAADIANVIARHWPTVTPDLRVIVADFPHSPLPRLEVIALLDE